MCYDSSFARLILCDLLMQIFFMIVYKICSWLNMSYFKICSLQIIILIYMTIRKQSLYFASTFYPHVFPRHDFYLFLKSTTCSCPPIRPLWVLVMFSCVIIIETVSLIYRSHNRHNEPPLHTLLSTGSGDWHTGEAWGVIWTGLFDWQ